jgi:hypothetical protein
MTVSNCPYEHCELLAASLPYPGATSNLSQSFHLHVSIFPFEERLVSRMIEKGRGPWPELMRLLATVSQQEMGTLISRILATCLGPKTL